MQSYWKRNVNFRKFDSRYLNKLVENETVHLRTFKSSATTTTHSIITRKLNQDLLDSFSRESVTRPLFLICKSSYSKL